MLHIKDFSFAPRLLISLFCAVLILASIASPARAQSGRNRRTAPRPTTPTATEETNRTSQPSPSPSTTPATATVVPTRYRVHIVTYVRSISFSMDNSRIPFGTFAERLQSAAHLMVTRGGEMNRGQARDRARSRDAEYVVWVNLESDRIGSGSDEQGSPDSWLLNYVIFTPRTGEVAAQGRVYQRPTYGSGTVLGGGRPRVTVTRPGRYPGGMIDYRALEGLGRETAERVIADLDALPALRP